MADWTNPDFNGFVMRGKPGDRFLTKENYVAAAWYRPSVLVVVNEDGPGVNAALIRKLATYGYDRRRIRLKGLHLMFVPVIDESVPDQIKLVRSLKGI
jgi:hypothetical protein